MARRQAEVESVPRVRATLVEKAGGCERQGVRFVLQVAVD